MPTVSFVGSNGFAAPVSAANPLPVTGSTGGGVGGAFTPTANSGAGSITTANTDQTILATNATRRFLLIQNTHATATIYIYPGTAAWSGTALVGFILQPGQEQIFDVGVPNSAIHAASATAGATFFILEG